MKHDGITRRDFLRGTIVGAAGLAVAGSEALYAEGQPASSKSIVAVARSAEAINEALEVNKTAAAEIVNKAVATAAGCSDPATAWAKLIKPGDTVGIVTTKHLNATHPEIADIVKAELLKLGVPEDKIKFPQKKIDEAKECTALIALPALKAHWLTGIGTVMKLYIMYSGKPSSYHNDDSAKLGEIWNLDFLKGKTRIVIVDALRPLCDKGPQPDPRYLWNYGGIIASTDPVAAEAVSVKIIQAKRDQMKGEPWPLSPAPLCLEAADKQYGLGTSDLAKIEIKKIGWMDGALI